MTEETRTTATVVGAEATIITIAPRETSWTAPRVPFHCIVSDVLSSMILQWRPFPQGWLITSAYSLTEGTWVRRGRSFTNMLLDAYDGKIVDVEGKRWEPDPAYALAGFQKDVVDVEATRRAYREEIGRAVHEDARSGALAEAEMFDWNARTGPGPGLPGYSRDENTKLAHRLIVRRDCQRYIFMRDDVVPAIVRELKRVHQIKATQ